MSRPGSSTTKFVYSMFVCLALWIGVLVGVRHFTSVFIALLTLFWHMLAHFYCATISSFRFSASDRHYFTIKNQRIRRILIRPVPVECVDTTNKTDNRMNVTGLVLHVINIVLLVFFEVLLVLPEMTCEPYVFTLTVGTRPRNYEHFEFVLDSFNEIIPAEGARAYALLMSLVFFVFVCIFNRRIKKHRESPEGRTKKNRSPYRSSRKNKWHSLLYESLLDLSVRKHYKRNQFWYNAEQLEQIEDLVRSASQHAELKLEAKETTIVSFTVIDARDHSVIFTGLFT